MRNGTLMPPALALPLVFLCGALSCLLATWAWRDAGNLQWVFKPIPSSSDGTAYTDGIEALSDAERLHQKIRILCLVVTHPGHHLRKAQHVHATWSRRCSRILFVTNTEPRPSDPDYVKKTCQILGAAQYMGSDLMKIGVQYCGGKIETPLGMTEESDESITTIDISKGAMPDVTKNLEWRSWFDVHLPILEVKDTNGFRDGLWNKTMNGFIHAHKFFLNDFDWFLKADDDTYVIMENLRGLLQHHQPEEEIYFGCHFKGFQDAGYMSGGGGYVLSRAAVKRFVDVLERESNWTFSTESEDVAVGQVMREGGVRAGDSHDSLGRARFFPLTAAAMASPDRDAQPEWYWKLTGQSPDSGPDCCSPTTISFHYMKPGDMYTMEMMLYHLKILGMTR